MRPDWTGQVVAYLCACKAAGDGFNESWERAMIEFPARGRDFGERQPRLLPEPGAAESVVEFFRRVCADAWHGRQPKLRDFSVSSMRDGGLDGGGVEARRASRQSADVAA